MIMIIAMIQRGETLVRVVAVVSLQMKLRQHLMSALLAEGPTTPGLQTSSTGRYGSRCVIQFLIQHAHSQVWRRR